MGSCRCKEIPKCSHDIRVVEEISQYFKDAKDKNENASTEFSGLANQSFLTFFCKNMTGLETEEKKLNQTLTEKLPDIIKKCEQKILSLDRELMLMIEDDTEYHEEQRRESESHHHDD